MDKKQEVSWDYPVDIKFWKQQVIKEEIEREKDDYNLEASDDEVLESDFSSDMSGRSFCTHHYERFKCAF